MRITRNPLAVWALFASVTSPSLVGAVQTEDLFIVLLVEKSLAEKIMEWAPESSRAERKALLESPRGREYVSSLATFKEGRFGRLLGRLQTTGPSSDLPRLLDHGSIVLNDMVVEGELDQVQALAEDVPVIGIYPVEERFPMTDAMPELLRATEAWEVVGGVENAGAGIRIAFIYSGVNIEHPMFNDDQLVPPEGFPLGGFPGQTNQQVIVARNFVRVDLGLSPQPIQDPRDELGHGSRVVGVAAGSLTETLIGTLRGIAPKAFIGNYRVFGDPSINGTTTNAAVLAAVASAVADGMDIITLSLGGPARNPQTDPEQIAIANASELGVVVVVAAGNRGTQGAGSVTSPGTSPEALTVGSSSHSRVLLPRAEFTSNDVLLPPELETVPYQPGTGPTITQLTGPLPVTHIAHLDASEEACAPWPAGSLAGRVALVKRGECLFTEKAANVFGAAQAAALLVYNNVPGRPISMDFSGEQIGGPAVMIDQQLGEALSEILQTGVVPASALYPVQNAISINVLFYPQFDQTSFTALAVISDEYSPFSGAGPAFTRIKPDLVAPGEAILSADRCWPNFINCGISYSNPGNTQGTSFSTPAVSGAAALILQKNPSWPSSWIRSAIVNTAVKTVTNNGEKATVNQAGNGRLDVLAAIQTPAVLEPLSLSFGLLDNDVRGSQEFLLTNVSTQTLTFHFSVVDAMNEPAVVFDVDPPTSTLMPGESVTVTLTHDAGSALGSGFFEGFVGVEAHSLTPAPAGQTTTQDLSISYWGSVTFTLGGRVLEVAQNGSAGFNTIGAALAAALPMDTIEVLDSATYLENLLIATDINGIPLHGLTLRASAGARPLIQGAENSAVLEARGVSNLSIEGFEFQGGNGMIQLLDSSGIIQDNILDGSEAESAGMLVALSNSHFHLFGNELLGAKSTAMGLFNASSALVQQNRIGTSNQPSGQHGFFAGTQSLVSLFQNVVDSSGASLVGQSVRLSGASGLLRGNRITRAGGPVADGVLVQGAGSLAELSGNLISQQSRFGIFVLNAAHLESLGDRILDNTTSGIRTENQASGRIRRARLFRNDLAASIQDSLLAVSDSLVAGISEGFELNSGSLNLSRSTVFGHSGAGINADSGNLLADHNIFSENAGGDVVGAAAKLLNFNLTDGLSAADTNIQGQARFVDPPNFDFTLTEQSDAIDRGDPSICCLEGDFFSHTRIADGNGDGQAVLDMGGVEFGSSSTPSLIAPVLAIGEGAFVGLALANSAAQVPSDPLAASAQETVSRVQLQGYDEMGQTVGEALEVEISSGTQSAFLIGDRFPAAARWIEIRPTQPDLLSFTLLGANDLSFMDGSQLSPAVSDVLILPEVQAANGSNTTLYLVNPEGQSQQVSLTLRRPGGPLSKLTFQLVAHGSAVLDVEEVFGTTSQGYLTVQAERSFFAMEIFGDEQARGGLLAQPQGSAAGRLFGAQLASNPEIDTRVNLINLGEATTATHTLRAEDGSQIASAQAELASGAQHSFQARDFFQLEGLAIDGWLEVAADQGEILGNVVFGDPAGKFKAALPLQTTGAREFFLSHIAEGQDIFTGVTLLNTDSGPALISIEAFDPQGGLLGRSFQILLAEEKRAFLLRELMPELGEQSGGYLRIRSTRKVLGFELFGNQDLVFLSAVSQQKVVE